jgi:hypothetical protein
MKRVLCVLSLVAVGGVACEKKVDPPPAPPPAGWGFREEYPAAVTADNGLTPAQRQDLYHVAEGSEVFPVSWFQALEDQDSGLPFRDNLERFGLLPDPAGPFPVGITQARSELGVQMIGINCSACHVGQMQYQGKAVRVDGAPNQFNIEGFYGGLIGSTLATTDDAGKLARFVAAVLAQDATPAPGRPPLDVRVVRALSAGRDLAALARAAATGDADARFTVGALERAAEWSRGRGAPARKAPGATADGINAGGLEDIVRDASLLIGRLEGAANLASETPKGTVSGFGRTDAFGIARNILFGTDLRPATAPIKYPHLWGFGETEWLHWNGNTNSIVERNIGQALGLGAVLNHTTYDSSVDLEGLHQLETLFRLLRPPVWPAEAFGALDAAKVARGETLYQTACASCHEGPYTMSEDRHVIYPQFGLDEIGTDRNHAENFDQPVAGRPYHEALHELLDKVKARAYARYPAEQTATWEAGRTAKWRSTLAEGKPYPARPLAGIWASAPYLHNGSVPTLYDLLSSPAARPKKFGVGYREFDPVKVGYRTDRTTANPLAHEFDTTQAGNGNGGHSYGTDLSDEDRAALIEYVKSK